MRLRHVAYTGDAPTQSPERGTTDSAGEALEAMGRASSGTEPINVRRRCDAATTR